MTSRVNMIAIVGASGNIGPSVGPTQFASKEDAHEWSQWFLDMTRGGIIVVGRTTYEMMEGMGWNGPDMNHAFAIWSRGLGETPDEFMDSLKGEGVPIFIAGGKTTFEVFMPYVDMFFIRRTHLLNPHGHTMPDLFGKRPN